MQWEASVGWYLSLCICITESRYGWYLCHLSISDLTAAIIISPPPALPPAICFSLYRNLTRILYQVYLYFSVSGLVLHLTLHILTTPLFLTLFRAVMVHFGNIHYMQRELVLGVSVLLFLYRVVCVLVCLFVCVCGCVSESIYKGISPGGVDASLQWRESKGGGGELVHSTCSKQPTSLKTSPY